MKTNQSSEHTPSIKSKRTSKDREKRKPESNNHSSEKGSPTKEFSARLYAGIDAESLVTYGQQVGIDNLSSDICRFFAEDINYRLRHLINDSMVRARLGGNNAISSQDVEASLDQLSLGKVYGAAAQPDFLALPYPHHNLRVLKDDTLSLVELAEEETVGVQNAHSVLARKWVGGTDAPSDVLKRYYRLVCSLVVDSDEGTRREALDNLATNTRVGSITHWFYNFSYILLSKDVTYDSLTVRALDLLKTLELSAVCRLNAPEKQLKLLVRLILQRLLKPGLRGALVNCFCNVLKVLAARGSLKEFIVTKAEQKLEETGYNNLEVITLIIAHLGSDAAIFLPSIDLWLASRFEVEFDFLLLKTYVLLRNEDLVDSALYSKFYERFGDAVTIFGRSEEEAVEVRPRTEFGAGVTVSKQLIKERRKICGSCTKFPPYRIEDVFDYPNEESNLYNKVLAHRLQVDYLNLTNNPTEENKITIGPRSALLSVFTKQNSMLDRTKYCPLLYNF